MSNAFAAVWCLSVVRICSGTNPIKPTTAAIAVLKFELDTLPKPSERVPDDAYINLGSALLNRANELETRDDAVRVYEQS